MQADEAQLIRSDIKALNGELVNQGKAIARIEEALKSEGERCPFREDIARGVNNVKRIALVEKEQKSLREANTEVRIKLAQAGIGGGVVGTFTFIGAAFGHSLGWW